MRHRFLRTALPAAALAATLGSASLAAAGAGGVTGPAFYVDGAVYRTVGTPAVFTGTGGPDHSYDVIYDFGGLQMNVADAAPGDRDYNGGRWLVHGLMVTNYAGALANNLVDMNQNDVLDSSDEVEAAIMYGYATDLGVVHSFECPVIKLPHRH